MIEHYRYGAIGVAVLGDYSSLHKRSEFLVGIFDKSQRNFTYGLEATLLVFDLAFNHYNINKLYTYVYEYNDISQNNTEKLGFTREGFLKKHHFNKSEQKFYDLYINGLVEEDFRCNKKLGKFANRLLGWDITQPIPKIQLSKAQQLTPEEEKEGIDKMRQALNNLSLS